VHNISKFDVMSIFYSSGLVAQTTKLCIVLLIYASPVVLVFLLFN